MHRILRRALICGMLCALLASAIPTASAAPAPDVPDGYWASQDITRCIQLGYFYLQSDGSFGPETSVSRSEFVVILCRFFGWKPAMPPREIYDDVPGDAWYAGAVDTANRQGALTGQDSRFRPEEPITRSEAASMLVRALGYGAISGLTQDLPLPFRDVTGNVGYITMAYGLGLMDGTSADSFSPNASISRAQAASLFMRLHEKLYDTPSGRAGIITSASDIPDLTGYDAVGAAAAYLVYNGSPQLSASMSQEEVDLIRQEARAAGTKLLLYVTGGPYQLRENSGEMAAVLQEAVQEGGYDGLFLDISGLTSTTQRNELTATLSYLREAMEDALLYVVAEAPSWKGGISGYDYAALGELADRVVLRVDYPAEAAGDVTAAPQEPLEEVYYALSRLRGLVDAEKLSLLVSAEGTAWGSGQQGEAVPGTDIAELLSGKGVQAHYSGRYASAYLETEDAVIWYLNGQAIRERTRLGILFGVGHLCLSELSGVLPEVLEAMPG